MSASWRRGGGFHILPFQPPNAPMADARRVSAEFGPNVEKPLPAIRTTAAAQNSLEQSAGGKFCTLAHKISDTFSGLARR